MARASASEPGVAENVAAADGDDPGPLRVATWRTHPDLVHGFFGRPGGTSSGAWATLNVSSRVGDDPAAVERNLARVRRSLGGVALVGMRQVHGDLVVWVRGGEGEPGEADGMMTADGGLGLMVQTADCVPILMIEPLRRLAMAVHAGWRGTVAGIARRAVDAARERWGVEPRAWHAALGPAIGGCCYEVGLDVGRELERRWGAMPEAWRPAASKGRLDLRTANRITLRAAGLAEERIVETGPCTSCRFDAFFSHRRSGGRTGRQASIVGWAK